MYKEYDAGTAPAPMQAVGEILAAADGFVIVTGEYNHSVPAALKNLLDHYQSEYLYKPSAIVSYSAGPSLAVFVAGQARASCRAWHETVDRAQFRCRPFSRHLTTTAMLLTILSTRVQVLLDEYGKALDEAYDGACSAHDKFLAASGV